MLENDSRENKMKVNCKGETLLGSLQGKQEVLAVAGGTWRAISSVSFLKFACIFLLMSKSGCKSVESTS